MHDGMPLPYDPIQRSRSRMLKSHSRGVNCSPARD